MNEQGILLVITVSFVTILLRFLPFWLFGGKRQTPKVTSYLGGILLSVLWGERPAICFLFRCFFKNKKST